MIGAVHSIGRSVQTLIGRAHYHFFDRHYIVTVRGLLIAACLGLTVLSVVLMQEKPLFGLAVVAGVAALTFMVFAYRNMTLICVGVLVVSTVFDVGVGSGTGTDIKLVLVLLVLLLFLWAVRLFVVERSIASLQGRLIAVPALLFGVAVLVSLVWSTYYVDPALRRVFDDKLLPRLMTALVLMISPLTTLLYANFMRSDKAFRFVVWWIMVVGGITVVMRILSVPIPPLINVKGQFPAWASMIAVGQFLFNRNIGQPWRWLLLLVPAGWVYVTFVLGVTWLGGWVPVIAGLAVLVALRSIKLAAVLGLAVAVVFVVNASFVNTVVENEENESAYTRIEALNRALNVSAQHFLFGTGPAGYHFYFELYLGEVGLTHNNYIDIIAQTGVAGTITFLWFWAAVGWMLWRTLRIVPRGGLRHGLAATALAAYPVTLGMMMLGDWVTPFTYTQTLSGISYTIWHWVMPGIALALYYDAQRERAASLQAQTAQN